MTFMSLLRTRFFLPKTLTWQKARQVLDVGTGCGMLGILAAKKAGSVVAVDLNPYAIRCAKENSTLNGVRGKIDFIQTSLFTALNPNASLT